MQIVRAIPNAFHGYLNTCGHITVHLTGHCALASNRDRDSITGLRAHCDSITVSRVLVSNRDRDSITVFRVHRDSITVLRVLVSNRDRDSITA